MGIMPLHQGNRPGGLAAGGGNLIGGVKMLLVAAVLVLLLSSCEALIAVADTDNTDGPLVPPPNFTRGLIITSAPAPLYPQRARSMGLEGWVLLSFSVDEEGIVIPGSVETVDEQPPGYFRVSALNAVRRMNFENTSNRVIDDVRYVFRYELTERDGLLAEPRSEPPRYRELIPMRYITPGYPEVALEQGLEGYVIVSFTVTENGAVQDIVIAESDPAGVFDAVALDAARRLRFEPRLVADTPVRVEDVTYRFEWQLPR